MLGLRRYFQLDRSVTFLNHGSFGATPTPVFRRYQRWQRELERQPVEFLGRRHAELMLAAREALAKYFNADAKDLVYTQNVTIAVNIVAHSLDLGQGDEVLASNHEYGACDRTWRFLAKERGFTYVNQPVSIPFKSREGVLDELWGGVTSQTRVIFLSHVTSPTAAIFPIGEVCRRARSAGILTIIDGAHAPGQIPLDLPATGPDFYGGNLHKWLCAPKGAGFLYARPDVQHLLKPLVVSWGYEAETPSGSTLVDYNEWWGTRDVSAFLSVPAAIKFQAMHKWNKVVPACHALLSEALQKIVEITGLPSIYPDDSWYVQVASALLPPETDIIRLKSLLYDEYRIEVPLMEWNGQKLIRISIQGYNTRRDVNRLLAALSHLLY